MICIKVKESASTNALNRTAVFQIRVLYLMMSHLIVAALPNYQLSKSALLVIDLNMCITVEEASRH